MFNHGTHLVVPIAFGGIGSALGFAPVFISASAVLLGGSLYGLWTERKEVKAARLAATGDR
jgi:hypothetical protein